MSAKNYFSDITDNVYFKIGLIIVIAIILFHIYRWLKNMVLFGNGNGDETTADAGQHINTNQLTFSNVEFAGKANTIERAAAGWGTDEDAIFTVLNSLRTSSDFYKLVQVYGVRRELNLIETLIDEFDDSEMEKTRSILENIGVSI
jgi:hypothetical protein